MHAAFTGTSVIDPGAWGPPPYRARGATVAPRHGSSAMSLASPAAPIRSRRSVRLLAAAATATAVALFAMGAGDAA